VNGTRPSTPGNVSDNQTRAQFLPVSEPVHDCISSAPRLTHRFWAFYAVCAAQDPLATGFENQGHGSNKLEHRLSDLTIKYLQVSKNILGPLALGELLNLFDYIKQTRFFI
jgi:hypothetical protein